MKFARISFLISMLVVLLAACGSGTTQESEDSKGVTDQGAEIEASEDKTETEAPPAEKTEPPKPVTLQLASHGTGTTMDEDFQNIVQDYLEKTYPHISIHFNPPNGATTIENLLVSGAAPDIIVTYNGRLAQYDDIKLLMDMDPLLKKHNVDLQRFEQNYLDDVRNASDSGALWGLPFSANFHVTYYNIDIFDQFGVEYPSDGMTWDEMIALAGRLSRTENGVSYRGLDPGNSIVWMSQPLSIQVIDPKTDEPTINTDTWQRVFRLAKSIYDVPGNAMISPTPRHQFVNDKNLAILLDLNYFSRLHQAAQEGLRWDVAQYPSYPEKPNTYGNASVYAMAATSTTKYPDEVTKALDLITSEEVQLEFSKIGKLSVLQSNQVKEAFGSGLDYLQDKNLPSIFKSTPVPYPVASAYRSQAESIAKSVFKLYVNGEIDLNTALKQAEEKIAIMVAEMKGK